MLRLEAASRLLDLACGVGRHAIEFVRRNCPVTGVDRVHSYLDQARERARAAGVSPDLVRSDLRAFVRPGAFDAALKFSASFGFFEDPLDDARVARNVAASLRPGGRALRHERPTRST
jgi:cyclopropane fatty-acyl-phospholipid synthase-like methyltransferase